VERIEGCVHIICRYCSQIKHSLHWIQMMIFFVPIYRCGHCFCYLCASPMSRDNHACKTCKRTWWITWSCQALPEGKTFLITSSMCELPSSTCRKEILN
jgi:hypothetical protein